MTFWLYTDDKKSHSSTRTISGACKNKKGNTVPSCLVLSQSCVVNESVILYQRKSRIYIVKVLESLIDVDEYNTSC